MPFWTLRIAKPFKSNPMTSRLTLRLFLLLIGIYACQTDTVSEPLSPPSAAGTSSIADPLSLEIFDQLKIQDSLLFEFGFNQCDTEQVKKLISDDFEFYHDQSGITESKKAFVESVPNLCNMEYKPIRKLDPTLLSVNVLKNNGEVYGAIQQGKHSFYAKETDKPIYLTSTAEFMHLWILENQEWKLKRVLSYNHQSPED